MEVLAVDFFAPWAVPVVGSGRCHPGSCRRATPAAAAAAAAAASPRAAPAWRPRHDVSRDATDGGAVVLRVETPGFPASALGVDLAPDGGGAPVLTVTGRLVAGRRHRAPPAAAGGGVKEGAPAASAAAAAAAEGAAAAAPAGAGAATAAAAAAADGNAPPRVDAEVDVPEVVRAFREAYRLPADVDPSAASAVYADGVLTVRVPKRAPVGRRSVPIGC